MRDAFHKPRHNGAQVDGKFVAIKWQWDGVVKNFRHDGAWDFQLPVPGYEDTNMMWWNGKGYDASGSKTEHLSPDTRPGKTAFIQGSTAGYFGHYYIHGIAEALSAEDEFPSELDSSYFVYQGENDISGQIELNGDGLVSIVPECNNITDASMNCDNDYSVKNTFEDMIDGLEVIAASDGLYAVIQEDSGNEIGERMFITSALEHEEDEEELTYYFMAQSGGKYNTRMSDLVGIPATSNDGGGSHEFSGVIDLSGMLAKKEHRHRTRKTKSDKKDKKTKNPTSAPTSAPEPESDFMISAHDGAAKRMTELMVPINEKLIALGLQAHNLDSGVVKAFKADRGGQVLVYQPAI